jgi:hypothetical protein
MEAVMIKRIRFITHAVGSWLGLRTLPVGVMYLYLAVQKLDLPGFPRQGDLTLLCPLFLLLIFGFVGIELVYRRAIGVVRLFPLSVTMWVVSVLCVVLGISGWEIDTTLLLPIGLFALIMAMFSLFYGWMEKRPFQFVIGILLVIAGFLPIILNKSSGDPIFGTTGFVVMSLIFLLFSVGGILDHLTIMNGLHTTLIPVDAEGGEDARAG